MGFFNLPLSTGLNFIEEGAFIGAKAQWYDTINFGISDTGYNSPNLPLLGQITNSDNVDLTITESVTT